VLTEVTDSICVFRSCISNEIQSMSLRLSGSNMIKHELYQSDLHQRRRGCVPPGNVSHQGYGKMYVYAIVTMSIAKLLLRFL
jgi:hypothetical protein